MDHASARDQLLSAHQRQDEIDQTVTSNVSAPVAAIEAKCKKQTLEVIEALEQGSRFRPYRNPQAKPSLKYTVVDTITYYKAVPQHPKKRNYADYQQIMARVRIRDWVETKGSREVWIWRYHSKEIAPVESNMASIHGNVSNSQRDASDLPVLGHTYTVYHYNYGRGTDMAVHNHLHRIEAVMPHMVVNCGKLSKGGPTLGVAATVISLSTQRRTTKTNDMWTRISRTGSPRDSVVSSGSIVIAGPETI